jgi:hypothetical protein
MTQIVYTILDSPLIIRRNRVSLTKGGVLMCSMSSVQESQPQDVPSTMGLGKWSSVGGDKVKSVHDEYTKAFVNRYGASQSRALFNHI